MEKFLKNEKGITRLTLLLLIIAILLLAGALGFTFYDKSQKPSQVASVNEINQEVSKAENSKMNEVKNTTINETNASSKKSSKNKTLSEDSTPGFGEVNLDYVESFGKIVTGYTGYKAEEDYDEWRLFYADSDNAYLIKNLLGHMALKDESLTGFGGDMTSSDYALGRSLNPKYTETGDWELETFEGKINKNIQAVAGLLDTSSTSRWNDYKTSLANWAIGAPTLEMFIASYNATHETQLDCTVEDSSSTGYKVNKDGKEFGTSVDKLGYYEELDKAIYCNDSYDWWLASPGAIYHGECLLHVNDAQYGELSTCGYGIKNGIRPLVCVPIFEIGNELKITEPKKSTAKDDRILIKTEPLDNETIVTGYYVEKDGEYAIIYADRLMQEGTKVIWEDDYSCIFPKLDSKEKENMKTYVISDETYEDELFGKRNIVKLADDNTGTEDRFYVMALENVKLGNGEEVFSWYDAMYNNSNSDIITEKRFGTGKSNTEIMINKWNNSEYDEQDDKSDNEDVWGIIQEQVDNGWFVPSFEEWCAFASFLKISSLKLQSISSDFWSSSQKDTNYAWVAEFWNERMHDQSVSSHLDVRLSTTF